MPSSPGSAATISRSWSLASCTATASGVEQVDAGRVLVEVRQGGDGGRARDLTGRVAAHAVGDDREPGTGVGGVLVAFADVPTWERTA